MKHKSKKTICKNITHHHEKKPLYFKRLFKLPNHRTMIKLYINYKKVQLKTILKETWDWSWRFGILFGFVYLVSPILNR